LHDPRGPRHEDSSPFLRAVDVFCDRLAWDLARDLSDENCALLKQIDGLRGNHFLIQAARHHDRQRLGRLVWQDYRHADGLETGIVHLAAAAVEPTTAAERAELVDALGALPPRTLKALLPIAWPARGAIAEALGWRHVLPLVDQIVAAAGLDRAALADRTDARNSADPSDGVLDVPRVRAALAEAGVEAAREALELFRSAQVGASNTVRLIEVLAGRERAWVEKGRAKRNQLAVKAYGLLPLERGEEEVAERYLWLRQFAREARAYGPQRQANEQAAVEVALSNLALNAGYPDAIRLEWAMEGRLGEAAPRPGEPHSIEGYEVTLVLDGLRPELRARRDGRALKSVPAAVRKSAAYGELAEAVKQLRAQAGRLSRSLERMMRDGEPLTPGDIVRLLRLPLGRAALTSLVFLAEDGTLGLLEGDGEALATTRGERSDIAGALRVAHPYDLFEAGVLGEWQREIVRRRIVQPFAQVFRELYVLTPAERESRDVSRRFAGHAIDAAVATRLFQARGWE
ncbi:MAG: DUF4132 domain-containing protein, partial [Thermomicrobiaceae bacterium]|nr:DUF4132 domain-containing protein [Thermomicrobiaceae bacterium]